MRMLEDPSRLFLEYLALPLGDRLLGQHMMKRRRFIMEAQYWDRAAIEAYKTIRLLELMDAAREVPFHAARLPSRRSRNVDLTQLPLMSKSDLRNRPFEEVTRWTGQQTYSVSTSGSTGRNLTIQEDPETAGVYRASLLMMLEWAGWRLGQRHVQTGMTTDRGLAKTLKDLMLRCHYADARRMGPDDLDRLLDLIEAKGIRHLFGFAASLVLIALRAEATHRTMQLDSVVSWGDMMFPSYRALIERVFRTRVIDTYGCAEGFHIAAQCEAGQYHTLDLDVIVELLDDNDNPIEPGELGRVVVTRLHAGVTPFIRYDTGDLASTSPSDRCCPCGRAFNTIDRIEGRAADVIETPSGNRLIVHFFTGILEFEQDVSDFQIEQVTADTAVLRLVPRHGAVDTDAVVRRLVEAGADMRFEVELRDQIPLSPGGKRQFVINSWRGRA